jgi:hypothetical protein
MRTIAYVDGYNLYHGRLKHTPFKWLDLVGLLSTILRVQNPSAQITVVKLFTVSRRGMPDAVRPASSRRTNTIAL